MVTVGTPLGRLTTWRVGGSARYFCRANSLKDLIQFQDALPSGTPITYLGLGSNVLISDEGIDGAVVVTQPGLGIVSYRDDAIEAEAGVSCAKLARFATRYGKDAAFLAGIPGTVGGALAMNAGAFGHQTWDYVDQITMLIDGALFPCHKDDFQIRYREVIAPKVGCFYQATFRFPNIQAQGNDVRAMIRKRNEQQPIGLPSAGSVFKNPEGQYAAALIDKAGLKGLRVGGATVSHKHANFIITESGACALDVYQLMCDVAERVYAASHVILEPEVRMLGEFPKGAIWTAKSDQLSYQTT